MPGALHGSGVMGVGSALGAQSTLPQSSRDRGIAKKCKVAPLKRRYGLHFALSHQRGRGLAAPPSLFQRRELGVTKWQYVGLARRLLTVVRVAI